MRKLTDEKIQRLITLRERGWSHRSIATDLGVSPGAVHYQCLRHGAISPRQTGRRDDAIARTLHGRDGRTFRPFTADDDRRISDLSRGGMSMNAIARAIGRPRTSVRVRLMTLAMHEELRA